MENDNISDVVVVEDPAQEGSPSAAGSETETTIDSTLGESAPEGEQTDVEQTEGEQTDGEQIEGEQTIDEKLDIIIDSVAPSDVETVTEESIDYSQLLYEFMVENYTPKDEVIYTVFDKPLNDYSVSEGILFLILVVLLAKCFINVIKDTLWRW